jgi:hypothetical protein
MSRKPKVNEVPFHYHLAHEAIRILRPFNCGIDETTDRFTVISLVVDYPEEHDCVLGLLSDHTLILQHAGDTRGIEHYRLFGSLHERAIEVAYRMMRMARAVVPQGGEE